MSDVRTPTLIAVFDCGAWEPRRVAEFRLTAAGAAELVVLDPEGCLFAEQLFRRGVEILGAGRFVTADDGSGFLRALLQPFGLSYYELVDQSPEPGAEPPGRNPAR